MARTKGRIVLTANPKENLVLAEKIYKKHLELGADSPLNLLEDVDWAATGPKIAPAIGYNDQAEFHKVESEKNYRERDRNFPEIIESMKRSIAILKASFGKNPKKLADWGITVDDTPKAKKLPKP